jgi:hypothetical protein
MLMVVTEVVVMVRGYLGEGDRGSMVRMGITRMPRERSGRQYVLTKPAGNASISTAGGATLMLSADQRKIAD